jgi:hypothetical protein
MKIRVGDLVRAIGSSSPNPIGIVVKASVRETERSRVYWLDLEKETEERNIILEVIGESKVKNENESR